MEIPVYNAARVEPYIRRVEFSVTKHFKGRNPAVSRAVGAV